MFRKKGFDFENGKMLPTFRNSQYQRKGNNYSKSLTNAKLFVNGRFKLFYFLMERNN